MLLAQLSDRSDGVIRRAVIYQKNIIFILRETVHFLFNFRHYMRQRVLRAVARNYKAHFLHTLSVSFFILYNR